MHCGAKDATEDTTAATLCGVGTAMDDNKSEEKDTEIPLVKYGKKALWDTFTEKLKPRFAIQHWMLVKRPSLVYQEDDKKSKVLARIPYLQRIITDRSEPTTISGFVHIFAPVEGYVVFSNVEETEWLPYVDPFKKSKSTEELLLEQARKPKVYLRTRPLIPEEREKSTVLIDGLKTKTTLPEEEKGEMMISALPDGLLQGFSGVLGMEATNKATYEAVLHPEIPYVLGGNHVSLFCYGHTGTGKTHTTMGYAEELGLFQQACKFLMEEVKNRSKDLDDEMFIQVRFSEIYMDKMYDLLDGRKECFLKEDERGLFAARRKPEKVSGVDHDTWEMGDQKFVAVKDYETLVRVLEAGIKTREVGTSMVHSQSSRSHAVMEMEVVNKSINDIREKLVKYEGEQIWAVNNIGKVFKEWREDKLEKLAKKTGKDVKDLNSKTIATNSYISALERSTKEFRATLDGLYASGRKLGLGGTLTLVDLAGADHPAGFGGEISKLAVKEVGGDVKKDAVWDASGEKITKEKKEFLQAVSINEALACLKDCIRCRYTAGHAPYRQSSLTKLLKNMLVPVKDFPNQLVMISNVSPSVLQERDSINTMRYAQLISGAEVDKEYAGLLWRNRDMRKKIRELYAERVPNKTPAEVEDVLDRWRGKESTLYKKMLMKYRRTQATEEAIERQLRRQKVPKKEAAAKAEAKKEAPEADEKKEAAEPAEAKKEAAEPAEAK